MDEVKTYSRFGYEVLVFREIPQNFSYILYWELFVEFKLPYNLRFEPL